MPCKRVVFMHDLLFKVKMTNIPFNSFVEPSNPRSSASRAMRVAPRLIPLKTLDSMCRLTRVAVVHWPMSVRPLPNSRRKKCWKGTSAKSAARRARLPNRHVWRPFRQFSPFISSGFAMERPLPKKVRHDVVAKFRNCLREMLPPRKRESPVLPRLKVTSSLNNSLISCHSSPSRSRNITRLCFVDSLPLLCMPVPIVILDIILPMYKVSPRRNGGKWMMLVFRE
mmetsp:Transcript_14927/g.26976  ORF Transcript_14927/g.26976 Transcript_14927/m.26976 type:complete len:225 (-) Transcript_14927:712-1386(-)